MMRRSEGLTDAQSSCRKGYSAGILLAVSHMEKERGILQGFRLYVAGAALLSAQAVMMPCRHVV